MFPVDRVPDGAIFAPHHFFIGAGLIGLVLATMWNDSVREPWAAAAALAGSTFSFTLAWPHYPEVGAALTLMGLGGLVVAPARAYWRLRGHRLIATYYVGVLVVADDVLEHAFGIATPLDTLWTVVLLPLVRWIATVL